MNPREIISLVLGKIPSLFGVYCHDLRILTNPKRDNIVAAKTTPRVGRAERCYENC